ncbi:MAG: S8 family serine peptidase [Bdellovibrionota bacterium]
MRFFSMIAVLAVSLNSALAHAAKVDPRLIEFGRGETTKKTMRVVALMGAPAQELPKPRRYHRSEIVRYLSAKKKLAWREIAKSLKAQGLMGTDVSKTQVYFINSSFSALVTPKGLRALAKNPGIKKIYYNGEITYDKPVNARRVRVPKTEEIPYDIIDMGLDKLMTDAPDLTGKGVVLGSLDTGVDGKHPALQGKIIRFYNGKTRKVGEPIDTDSHGTHTVGTMVGGDRSNLIMGMAPDAKVIAAGALDSYDDMLKGMQWLLDPDGDASTKDSPRAINNSWNCNGAPDVELFYKAIAAWEAAGIIPVFSAGNAGQRGITKPHEYPGVIAVGATGKDGKITDFSSRGPAKFRGKTVEKPDLTAPGSNIRSTIPGGGFAEMSGTSMASPHVAGAIALLLQMESSLNPAQVRELLLKTAVPMEPNGAEGDKWNRVYGFGKINIFNAAKAIKSLAEARLASEMGIVDLGQTLISGVDSFSVDGFFSDPGLVQEEELEVADATEEDGWVDGAQL